MTFEDLPSVWQSDRERAPDPEAVLAAAVEQSRALEKTVRGRDRLETVASLAMVPLFAASAAMTTSTVARTGAVILTVACLVIPLRLRAARLLFDANGRDGELRAFLRSERERVAAQARLLRTVLWWYLLPLGVGVVMLFGGGAQSWPLSLGYAAFVTVFYAWLYRLNQRAVAEHLKPRLVELDSLLSGL